MANYQIGDVFLPVQSTAQDYHKITGFDPFMHKFIMEKLSTGDTFNYTEGEINMHFIKVASAAMSPPVSSSLVNAAEVRQSSMISSQQNVVTTQQIMPENSALKKCECGCAAVGISKHSNYCPLFKQENS